MITMVYLGGGLAAPPRHCVGSGARRSSFFLGRLEPRQSKDLYDETPGLRQSTGQSVRRQRRASRRFSSRSDAMNVHKPKPASRRWTAAELRKLQPAERDAILEDAAARAEDDYRNDPQMTAFEAFGKDDLHGESSSTEAR
jgi:hypothetical protein